MAASARPPRRPAPFFGPSLLRDLLENPLDAGYRSAADRRRDRPPAPWWQRVLVLAGCVVMGLGSVWAARELRAPPEGPSPARALLLEQIEERTGAGEALREENAEVATEIGALEQAGRALLDEDLAAELDRLAVASGAVAVTGPGLVITLEDSAAAQEGIPGSEDERVTDADLQVLVNALWAAGAEAVAVDGHRLGPTTAVRAAGEAILVNLAPTVSPYVVEAVGDPVSLQTGLARTPAAGHLSLLEGTYGIDVAIRPETAEDALRLGALPAGAPRYAEHLEEGA